MPGDLVEERDRARELVGANRLLRQTAERLGDRQDAAVLEDLEHVLLEVANAPDAPTNAETAHVQQRIAQNELLFKVTDCIDRCAGKRTEIMKRILLTIALLCAAVRRRAHDYTEGLERARFARLGHGHRGISEKPLRTIRRTRRPRSIGRLTRRTRLGGARRPCRPLPNCGAATKTAAGSTMRRRWKWRCRGHNGHRVIAGSG